MKLLFTLILSFTSYAGAFKIPRDTHNLAQLDEVQKKASKAKQPIAFVIAEKKMTAT
ncbi:MAG: hypothetical protein L7U83_05935 [Akkermansiaceae bacterium]|jgi:hypothetical protein|nr:hypothetical protein [bacterium]MCH1498594.1 hypothetical protein [Akkermansiaceae bacterium]MDC0187714.1 hypothetical protein [Verrucomicrobiota bacterium]|tara:strand:+ start:272 stop:442 length:171 start_codon:yes stop_codon:yes gene_type:complete